VSLKFAAAGRYGIHEAVYSPQLVVQSATMPVDNSIELTGTDGILWVRNLTATMVETPKLMLKRKDQVTVWDDRVEYEFPRVLRDVRAHFVDCLRGKARPAHDVAAAQRALAVNCAAHASLAESRAVAVASVGVG
jgi:predicted dehydrogenase